MAARRAVLDVRVLPLCVSSSASWAVLPTACTIVRARRCIHAGVGGGASSRILDGRKSTVSTRCEVTRRDGEAVGVGVVCRRLATASSQRFGRPAKTLRFVDWPTSGDGSCVCHQNTNLHVACCAHHSKWLSEWGAARITEPSFPRSTFTHTRVLQSVSTIQLVVNVNISL